jgi:hypothetical protein
MARKNALGGWLKETKGKDQERRRTRPAIETRNQLVFWRLRGCLWGLCFFLVVVADLAAALEAPFPLYMGYLRPVLPALAILSLLWTFWDPTYSALQDAHKQGRDVRVHGKANYLVSKILLRIGSHSSCLTAFARTGMDESIYHLRYTVYAVEGCEDGSLSSLSHIKVYLLCRILLR